MSTWVPTRPPESWAHVEGVTDKDLRAAEAIRQNLRGAK